MTHRCDNCGDLLEGNHPCDTCGYDPKFEDYADERGETGLLKEIEKVQDPDPGLIANRSL